ncbi:E3 ubiquitin-protein ligase RNF14-like [Planococcus citri]|uniref:E3 ubiquitin-protein ligase RNF14-like n=1 Tax=Planococcus citri TaxID=170843 RepID=UPI0031F88211
MAEDDKERQIDEVEVLESIYPKELYINTKYPFSGCLKISPSTPEEEFPVKIISKLGNNTEERMLKIQHLPPIELYFQCPSDYPSKSQPYFMLSCLWLPDNQLSEICRKLDTIWDANESEILFAWTSFLKEDCCKFLHIEELRIVLDMDVINHKLPEQDESTSRNLNLGQGSVSSILREEYANKTLNVKPLNVRSNDQVARSKHMNSKFKYMKNNKLRRKADDENYKYETPKDLINKAKSASKENNVVCDKPIASKSREDNNSSKCNHVFKLMNMYGKRRKISRDNEDTRIIPKPSEEIGRIAKLIEEFNDRVLETEFRTENHSCEVCFDVKLGTDCIRVKPCKHVFCKCCLKDYLTLNIVNGNVGSIRCLQFECDSSLTDLQIRQNIDEETYLKYRKFSVKLAIENDPNLLYCPREICQSVARISTLSPEMCHCGTCQFYFCIYCKKAYHGVQMCNLKSEERLKVIREYQECSLERKLELEKRFSKQQLQKWVQDDLSEKWLEACSKPCPNCKAVIQKIDGCNKMMCLNCNTPFCWLCNLTLNRSQPYKHFIDPESPCYQKLFPPEEMEEEHEFIDEDEEDDEEFINLIDEMLNANDGDLEELWPYYYVE